MADGAIDKRWKRAQDSLVLQSADFSLSTLYQMVESDQIDMAPSTSAGNAGLVLGKPS